MLRFEHTKFVEARGEENVKNSSLYRVGKVIDCGLSVEGLRREER